MNSFINKLTFPLTLVLLLVACVTASISAYLPSGQASLFQATSIPPTGGAVSTPATSDTPQPAQGGTVVDPDAIAMLGYILLAVAGAILLVALFSLLLRPDRTNGSDHD